ncbi:hypothetical protein PENSPDRAFT_646967 [Peniophora sp. CONT]|nr:hypothetical protein PENSPDRAFT_646967 [Peniophora sp. CONT]
MFIAADAPTWLSEAGERRLREITAIISSGHRPPGFPAVLSADVTALQGIASEIQRSLNIYNAPILRLSPEILGLVFEQCEAGLAEDDIMDMIVLGHVCQGFRSALLNTRTFWAQIPCLVKPEAREQVLSRAGTAALTLSLDYHHHPGSIDVELVNFVKANVKRSGSLSLITREAISLPWTPHNLSDLELPLLKHLSLEVSSPPPSSSNWHGTKTGRLQPIQAPNLQHLNMRNVYIPFPSSNLVILELRQSHSALRGLTYEEFLRVLARCTKLQCLVLSHATPSIEPSPTPLPMFDPIELPALRSLNVEDTLVKTETFCRCLNMPSVTEIEVKCDPRAERFALPTIVDRMRLDLTSLLAKALSRAPITGLRIMTNRARCSTVCQLIEEDDPSFYNWKYLLSVDAREVLDLSFGRCKWDAGVPFTHFIDCLAPYISKVRNAEIDCDDNGDSTGEDVKRLLATMPSLTALHLSYDNEGTLAALAIPSQSPEANALPTPIPLPHLQHLLLSQSILRRRIVPFFTASPSQGWETTKMDIISMVASRARAGVPLQSVTFGRTVGLDEEEADVFTLELEEYVTEVNVLCGRLPECLHQDSDSEKGSQDDSDHISSEE